MTLADQFEQHPICPACYGARELTTLGLCHTCSRLWRAGRLSEYRQQNQPIPAIAVTKGRPMFEPLLKRTSTGAVQIWQIRVEPQDDDTAYIVTTHGQVDGKPQESRDHIREGKNPGKKNATTAIQQAIKEAEAQWSYQRDRNLYGLTVEESEIKRSMAPMLAQSFTDKNGKLTSYANQVQWGDTEHTHVQPKFDGHRSLAKRTENGITLTTRKGTAVVTCGHLVQQLMPLIPMGMTIDGELYIHGVPVTTIGGYISKEQAGTQDLCFMMYDIVETKRPFAERVNYLQNLMSSRGSHLHLARTQPVSSIAEVLDFQAQCVENGYEGAILRHGLTGYEPGDRSASLIKVKTFVDSDFVIVGCTEGRGDYEGVAVFECVTKLGAKFGVTAPGDMAEKRAFWLNHQAYIGKKLTVKYQKLTETTNPVPFQPVAKCIAE